MFIKLFLDGKTSLDLWVCKCNKCKLLSHFFLVMFYLPNEKVTCKDCQYVKQLCPFLNKTIGMNNVNESDEHSPE